MTGVDPSVMSLGYDTIITYGGSLPPALGVLARIRGLLDEPDCDLADIVELLQVDPALTFQIIRLSNSALYGLGSRCSSLDEAVARVGFGEIQQLVSLIVARQALQGDLALYGISAARLWQNAVAVGSLASALAGQAGMHPGGAYSAGLLRSLGRIILNNYPGAVRFPTELGTPDVFAWEKSVHGVASPEITATLLNHWRFPTEISGAVCLHLTPAEAAQFTPAAAVLHLACAGAVEWDCALPGEITRWNRDADVCALAGLREDQLAGAFADARRQFDRFAAIEWTRAA